jgi:adenylate cyclase
LGAYSFIESVVRLEDSTEQRRLAAILAADVVGYAAEFISIVAIP